MSPDEFKPMGRPYTSSSSKVQGKVSGGCEQGASLLPSQERGLGNNASACRGLAPAATAAVLQTRAEQALQGADVGRTERRDAKVWVLRTPLLCWKGPSHSLHCPSTFWSVIVCN